ncbi:hypothetical protein DWB85_02495 [Seongchinamella sediminis]|uniref:Uncharacterized protein n=2 Tax=Seongchinamella sediminis TaxID=2283635 RepID=A0A3L7E4E8_9GAMM|nr:hypothetical protein DWB85_02495 [Seongchinamella sediminis]
MTAVSTAVLLALPGFALAQTEKDCLLEGTVHKSGEAETGVTFHSARRYDEDARCRVRRSEKMEFKLPADPRLQEAPDGSTVKYRYQEQKDGSSKTELVSIGA